MNILPENNLVARLDAALESWSRPITLENLVRGISKRSREPLLTAAEMKILKQAQGTWSKLETELATFSDDKVKSEWLRRRGTLGTPAEDDGGFSRDTVANEYRERRQAIKARMLEVNASCLDVVGTIMTRVAAMAQTVADEIEAAEHKASEGFEGYSRIPSPLALALRALSNLRNRVPRGLSSPQRMVSDLGVQL